MDKLSKEDYNNEPVYYCSDCLSLRIRDIDGVNYCDKCSSTNIEQTHIQEWEQMYNRKYYGNYLNLGK
jgi:hypothetical protein